MRRLTSAFFALGLATSITACADDDVDEQWDLEFSEADETDFRMSSGITSMAIYFGEGTTSEDCIIWDIMDNPGGSGGSADDAQTGENVLTVTDDGQFISRAGGGVTCNVVDGTLQQEATRTVRAGDVAGEGEVVFTVWHKWVFDGELNLHGLSWGKKLKVLKSKLLYTYQGDHIYDGPRFRGDILMTATENIRKTSDAHKLLVTALIEGACGAPGLDASLPDTPPDHDGSENPGG